MIDRLPRVDNYYELLRVLQILCVVGSLTVLVTAFAFTSHPLLVLSVVLIGIYVLLVIFEAGWYGRGGGGNNGDF